MSQSTSGSAESAERLSFAPKALSRRSLIVGGALVATLGGLAAGSLFANPVPRRIAFVGDAKHYFEVEHARILGALGERFVADANVVCELFPIEYENPERLASVAQELSRNPPDFVAVIGDDEAQVIKAAIPNVPMVFSINHDGATLGLSDTISRPSAFGTGHCGDQLEHVMPLVFIDEIFDKAQRLEVAVAASPAWFSRARMEVWQAASDRLRINLRPVAVDSFASLASGDEWQDAGDFDAWILPLGKPSVVKKQEMVNHFNANKVLSVFERFTATRIGAPLAYASTSLYWYDYFALALRLLVAGVPASEIPVRTASAWRYAANANALQQLGIALPPSVVARINEIY